MINEFTSRIRYWLEHINQSPNIIYKNDFDKQYLPEQKNKLLEQRAEQLEKMGFVLKENNVSYSYTGPNPALALTQLLTVDPLFMECERCLVFADLLALKDVLGDEKFNQYIHDFCDNELSLSNLPIWKRPDINKHPEAQQSNLEDLEMGDRLYLYGNPAGFGVHPKGNLNGHHVLYLGEGKFLGFSSVACQPQTYAEHMRDLNDAFNTNLTYSELDYIDRKNADSPDEMHYLSNQTYGQVYNAIIETGQDIYAELKKYDDNEVVSHGVSQIAVPESLKQQKPCGVSQKTILVSRDFYWLLDKLNCEDIAPLPAPLETNDHVNTSDPSTQDALIIQYAVENMDILSLPLDLATPPSVRNNFIPTN